ncbi:cytochrome c [Tropicimonas sp. TH_r6]|uniref:c-type cytochrome n=1 Tax=Tropicimonas sp. TH_r6 TaxID=3082085 RepID=UPI002953C7F7|nr:cytochrome c [Tropicimonas sp. TH_r6]MDV7141480.1 cytochrome c [Tropicimonas sp. TH_r6]
MLLPIWSSETTAAELLLPEDQIKAGRTLFLKNCAKCHGKDASGGSAPDVQGMILKDVVESVRGVEAMPEIALSEVEAKNIAVFLMSLSPDQARLRLGIN